MYLFKCNKYSLWVDEEIVYPNLSIAPLPVKDMPEDVKEDFLEARNIVKDSPRGSAALLRLGLQKLMLHLRETGDNINQDIGNLVKKGLPVTLQQAADSLRVIGNEAVHPGKLDLKDDVNTALGLFKLLNKIVDVMIIQPKISQIYGTLPESKIKGIKDRDNN